MQTKVIREPLGGVEVPGFGPWLKDKAMEVEQEIVRLRKKLELGSPLRTVVEERHRSYAELLHRWHMLTTIKMSPEGGKSPRADFENHLITRVVVAADLYQEAAQGRSHGRSLVLIDSEYDLACLFLARYLGIAPRRVKLCGNDRNSVAALGGVR